MSAPSFPYWASPPLIPTKPNGYSFSSNPLVLVYGESASLPVSVSFLNGSLPPGTRWQQSSQGIEILGEIEGIDENTDFEFTFRLNNGTSVSDQTFFLTVTSSLSNFYWKTNNQNTLLYYYTPGLVSVTVRAEADPPTLISYSFAEPNSIAGVSLEGQLGLLNVDLSWMPNTQYLVNDLVFSNLILYQCIQGGLSDAVVAPSAIGDTILDSSVNLWQPVSQYQQNDLVILDTGVVLRCVQAGVSGTSMHLGSSPSISDGSVVWQFRYQAAIWQSVTPGVVLPLNFVVQAHTQSQMIEREFSISVISPPSVPIWITPEGDLGSYTGAEWVAFQLQALEINQQLLRFEQTQGASWPSWLNLTVDGELWGQLPSSSSDQFVSFSITARDDVGSVDREFSIIIKQNIVTLSWISNSQLGSISDGGNCWFQVKAQTSVPGAYVTYQLTGGMIPPNTVILESSGNISGFVEYHSLSRSYCFEISATEQLPQRDQDGNFTGYIPGRTIVKQFELEVIPQNKGKFVSLSVPLFGQPKLDFIRQNNNSLADEADLFVSNDPRWGRNQKPEIVLIDGLAWSDPSQLVSKMRNWMHNFRLVASHVGVSNVNTLPYQTLFLQLKDSNSLSIWQPNTVYETNTRISTGGGGEFVAIQGGTSGKWPAPSPLLDQQTDNTVIWQREAGQNSAVSLNTPLPWYPQHEYNSVETAVSSGVVLDNEQVGISGGEIGPNFKDLSNDGSTSWRINSGDSGDNSYWPPSIKNIRDKLIASFGLASGVGKLAQAQVQVDSTSGSITTVKLIGAGNGYYKSPKIQVLGTGRGATVSCTVGLNSGTVSRSGLGFSVGKRFTVSQGLGRPGIIQISQVDTLGKAQSISIVDSGNFTVFPSNEVAFSHNGQVFFVQFDLGIAQLSIENAGSGYDPVDTKIDFGGQEYLPLWQSEYTQAYLPCIELAWINNSSSLAQRTIDNPFEGHHFEIKQLKMQIQGLDWQGVTRWDNLENMFDCGYTRFIETDSFVTSFDNKTQFDNNTLFDSNLKQILRYDPQLTIDMMYEDINKQRSAIPQSATAHIWLLQFGSPLNNP